MNKDEKSTKEMYDKFGVEYQKSRDENHSSRLYNEFLEVPSMIKAVGNIKGKKLLDVGCGAGVHIQHYLKKEAKCSGIDISETLIKLARKRCPEVDFEVGSMLKLPYKDNSFDVVTMSLALHYVDNIKTVLEEVNRVLKKGGLFYYSTDSLAYLIAERYEDNDYKIKGICEFTDKRTGKTIVIGNTKDEGPREWEMLPGMKIKNYKKQFRTQLKSLIDTGFEFIDVIDCEPTEEFKERDPEEYKLVSKIPIFSIYVVRKK
jgi:ubiquinone/menaquinone biosynthesis C-methylase UbiE